jgi:hypothetical protein
MLGGGVSVLREVADKVPIPISEPCIIEGISESIYHADPVVGGSLSQSGAKVLLRSPALFDYQRTHPRIPTPSMESGSGAHAVALGAGMDSIYVAPFDNWQTKAAQTERKIAREEGLSPLLPKQWDVIADMAEVLSNDPHVKDLGLLQGEPEVALFAPDEDTGVWRRALVDSLLPDLCVDYKTTADAHPEAFGRSCGKFGYHQQAAWYLDLARDLGLPIRGFLFIAQLSEPPYSVTIGELHPDDVALGRARNAKALQMYRDCVEAGVWPTWDVSAPERPIHTLRIPPWHHNESEAG